MTPPTPLNEAGWTLSLIVRASISDPIAGDLTVINFPAAVDLPPVANGKLKLKTTLHELAMAGPPPNVLGTAVFPKN
jgi:hypothetical protein